MCGIIGYIGNNNCILHLTNGLKRLEYRGYDSAGIAIINNKELKVYKEKKEKGKLQNLINLLNEKISEFFKDDGSIVEDEIGFARKNEYYLFSSKRTPVFELKKIFTEKFEKGDRVGAIFITENGKQSERLLGIITSWDLVGK